VKEVKRGKGGEKEAKVQEGPLDRMFLRTGMSKAKQERINKRMTYWLGGSTVPVSVVEDREFRAFVKELNPDAKVPGRSKVMKDIGRLSKEVTVKIRNAIKDARRVSFTVDIWSSAKCKNSYIGVTIHMFNFRSGKRERYRIACRRFDVAHSGINIANCLTSIFEEYNFSHKAFYGLSDNGSNMIKGLTLMAEEEADGAEGEQGEQEEEDDEEEDNMEDLETDLTPVVDADDDEEPDSENEEEEDNEVEDFADSMEVKEKDQMAGFGSLGLRRIPCFPHTLQLPILKTVKQRRSSFGRSLKKTRRMVVKYRRSSKAKNILDRKFKRRLKGYCKTRWWTDNDMVRRVVEARETETEEGPDPLTYLVEEMEWSQSLIITENDLKYLKGFLTIMEPLQEKSDLLGAEERSTIHLVYPSLLEIEAHLSECSKGITKTFATRLKTEIKKYFSFAFDDSSPKFDPIFRVGTYLSPIHRHLLKPGQIKMAEDHIRVLLEEDEAVSRLEQDMPGDDKEQEKEQEVSRRGQERGSRSEELMRGHEEGRREGQEATEEVEGGGVGEQVVQTIIPGMKFMSSQLLRNANLNNNQSSSLE
jgi:hypothetical protein